MKFHKLSLCIASTVVLAVATHADVVGKWTGKMVVTDTAGKAMPAQAKGFQLPSLTLELKADKTYKGVQKGGQDGKEHTAEGKWSLSGATLTLNPLKRDGKAVSGDGAKPRVYTLSKDGQTLTLDLTAVAQAAAKGQANGKDIPQFKARMVLRRG